MSEWRDISTAPKDGTAILVCRYGKEDEPTFNVVYWDAAEMDPDYSWGMVEGGSFYHNDWPTHWQPLEPPKPIPDIAAPLNRQPSSDLRWPSDSDAAL